MSAVRIRLKNAGLLLLAFAIALAQPQPSFASSRSDAIDQLEGLIVKTGPFAGVPRVDPRGGINWYFANVAFANALPELANEARAYMNVFLSDIDPDTQTVTDVAAGPSGELTSRQQPDSHDAYAGTFLLLAVRYVAATGDEDWWRAHVGAIKDLAYANILDQIKDDGLVRAFQNGRQPASVSAAEASTGYLIDNSEAYAGLRALADRLRTERDPDAAYYEQFVPPLADAIAALFDPDAGAWRVSDQAGSVNHTFYPDCLAQVYPGLYGVASSTPDEERKRDAAALRFLQRYCRPPATAPASQRLAIATYAATVGHDPAFAREAAADAAGDAGLPALAWRLYLAAKGAI